MFIFEADLDDLDLSPLVADALADAIEERAALLCLAGAHVACIAADAEAAVMAATGDDIAILTIVDDAAAEDGRDVLILAAVPAAQLVTGLLSGWIPT